MPQDKADPTKITNTQRIDGALPTIKKLGNWMKNGCFEDCYFLIFFDPLNLRLLAVSLIQIITATTLQILKPPTKHSTGERPNKLGNHLHPNQHQLTPPNQPTNPTPAAPPDHQLPRKVLEKGAKAVVLASHLGRPDGSVVSKFSMAPVAKILEAAVLRAAKTDDPKREPKRFFFFLASGGNPSRTKRS